MGNYIDTSASIIHSSISDSAQIWKDVRIEGSTIASLSSVGDDSIVVNSILGEKCEIGRNNIISNVKMGNGSSTQSNTTIRYAEIGRFCAIAWNVTIGAPNHETRCLAMAHPDYIFTDETRTSLLSYHNEECIIGNDVWICAGAHVTRGVTVADGAVIAANAVVTKDVPHYAIVAGVPAKVTGYRFDPRTIEKLKRIRWWELPQNVLDQCRECFRGDLTDEKLSILESKIQGIPEGKNNGR